MIDEMMTLLESDDEAKALTRQITGQRICCPAVSSMKA